MKKTVGRALVETYVRIALHKLKDDPERGLRSMVDMALQFSKGKLPTHFFDLAQKMLSDESSPYYTLLRETVAHTDLDTIATFGVNVGYQSCAAGAKLLRESEQRYGFPIPWALVGSIDPKRLRERPSDYEALFAQGRDIGIYIWFLYTPDPTVFLPLANEAEESTFFLFCEPEAVTEEYVELAGVCQNVMTLVRLTDEAADACARLRDEHRLYSVFYNYGEKDAAASVDSERITEALQLWPIFTVLVEEPGCPESVADLAHEIVMRERQEQRYPTILAELREDVSEINRVITEKYCAAEFEADGALTRWDGKTRVDGGNVFANGLASALAAAKEGRSNE